MHKLSGIFLLMILFGACKPTQQQAVEYSDRIINQQRAIDQREREMISSLEDSTAVEAAYAAYMQQVQASLDTVGNLEEFGHNTAFRDAAIKLFTAYKEVGEKEYREVVSIMKKSDDRITEDDKQRVNNLLNKITIKLNTELAELNRAQEAFAKEYQVQIEEKKTYK